MSNKIDKVTEHYLIPLLLAFGSISLIVSFFYWNEYRNVATKNFLYPYYPINSVDGVKAFLINTSKSGLGFFAITVCCLWAVISKKRIICFLGACFSVLVLVNIFAK